MTLIIFSINIKEHNYVRVGRIFKTHPFPCLKSLLSCKAIKKKKLLNRKSIVVLYIFPELETNDGDRKYHFVFFYPPKRLFSKIIIPKPCSKFIPKPFYVFCCLNDVSKVFCNSFFHHHLLLLLLLFFFGKLLLINT